MTEGRVQKHRLEREISYCFNQKYTEQEAREKQKEIKWTKTFPDALHLHLYSP